MIAPAPLDSLVYVRLPAGRSVTVYPSVDQLPETWDHLGPEEPLLSRFWCRVFAEAGGPETEYLMFRNAEGDVLGKALLQYLPVANMKLGERLRPDLAAVIAGSALRQFGQVLHAGTGGHWFVEGTDGGALLQEYRAATAHDRSATSWLIKDIDSDQLGNWTTVEALPEMVLAIPDGWESEADYQEALPSKYRRRARRAKKKFSGLQRRDLSVAEAESLATSIGKLYSKLAARASYIPFRVPDDFAVRLKQAGGEAVRLSGYFDGDVLVGFSTLLAAGDTSLAHYAAIQVDYNYSHQLYLNVLLDLLSGAIANGATQLRLGRTATTIKSSLGAKPVYHRSYVAHDGCIRNQLLGKMYERVQASTPQELIQQPLG